MAERTKNTELTEITEKSDRTDRTGMPLEAASHESDLDRIKREMTTEKYDFLRTNENLGDRIMLLTLGGSYAYGTNNEGSDIDIRGVAINSRRNIFTGRDFGQVTEPITDTTIYSFTKLVPLLCNCNPNTIELLGNDPEAYIVLSEPGKLLLDNKKLFLSRKAIYSFGGYANQQLRRMENKANRLNGQAEREAHILKTIEHAEYDFRARYFDMPEDAIKLYIDEAIQEGYDTEIFMDVTLKHYPLRDFKGMISEMQSIVNAYGKIGKRNEKAIEHNKLGKHMMHLIRLYMMCIDILERGEIKTKRTAEHDLLMEIRGGRFLDDNNQPTVEFYEMLDEFEKKLDYAARNTSLPETPDMDKIYELMVAINEFSY